MCAYLKVDLQFVTIKDILHCFQTANGEKDKCSEEDENPQKKEHSS